MESDLRIAPSCPPFCTLSVCQQPMEASSSISHLPGLRHIQITQPSQEGARMAYKSRGRRSASAACGSRSLVLRGPAWTPLAYLGRKGAQVPLAHQQRGLLEYRPQRPTHWDTQALEWLSEDVAVLRPGGRELLVQPGQESSPGVTKTKREGAASGD